MTPLIIRNGRVIDPANKRDEIADRLHLEWKDRRLEIRNSREVPDGNRKVEDHRRQRVNRGAWLNRHARAPARAGIRSQGNNRIRHARRSSRRIHDGCLHAEYFSGGRQSEHDCLDQRSRGEQSRVCMFCRRARFQKISPVKNSRRSASLAQAGVVAITDDGHCIQNHELMRRASQYARMVGVPVLDHCQDYNLVGNGVVHEGYWSTLLGLPGWPAAGEEAIVMREHFPRRTLRSSHSLPAHHSGGSVRLLREARARGVKISGEICPHHIALTDEAIQNFDTNYKMNPPLRSRSMSMRYWKESPMARYRSCVPITHRTHDFEKEVEFDVAPFGIIGLETELGPFHRPARSQTRQRSISRV